MIREFSADDSVQEIAGEFEGRIQESSSYRTPEELAILFLDIDNHLKGWVGMKMTSSPYELRFAIRNLYATILLNSARRRTRACAMAGEQVETV
ncbi:MAG: hypothetical protein ACRC8S_10400 [Fimbriiglobus sp.]